jgi:ATP-dependent Clp protease ATP-binding subunit ClpC
MTSNIGAKFIQKRATVGFQSNADTSRERLEEQVMSAVKQTFAPEFINRLDEIIIFDELSDADLMQIIDLQTVKLNDILEKRAMQIRLTDDAKLWLVKKACVNKSYGARPLKRALQKYVEDELSEALINGSLGDESLVEIGLEGDKLVFRNIEVGEIENLIIG